MPRDLPEEAPGRYYVVSSTVYGAKDAPRGWCKNINGTMLEKGLRGVPNELASYVYNEPKTNRILGLAVIHVDDLLWTGGPEMEAKMKEILEIYRFFKVEKNEFKYCGRRVKRMTQGSG